jgi:transposase
MDVRELKALELAAKSRIAFDGKAWLVPSQSGNGKYRVTIKPEASCTCEDFQLRQRPCKHVIAARIVCARDRGGKHPEITTDAVPKRPTYRQDWPEYDRAQRTEKHRFLELLFELCRTVEEPPPPRCGRQPHTARDAVFAMAFKVYSTFSSRRFDCDLKDAHARGYLSRPVPGPKVCAFFENPRYFDGLAGLITRSSLPLRIVETDFAVDSSGFSTSRFVRWYDEKHGVERSGKEWVKAHLICGVKTNVVTAVRILDKNAADCPQFVPLLQATAGSGFRVEEASADKAYASVENIEAVADLGGTAFVPFRSNQSGAAGGLWEKMYHYFRFRREEFLKHYHKRSNVESTFSMVKAKFKDSVRSKTDVAMKSEVLCKLLCHNLCVVHQSHVELGIEPVFWQDDQGAGEAPAVLPLVRPG